MRCLVRVGRVSGGQPESTSNGVQPSLPFSNCLFCATLQLGRRAKRNLHPMVVIFAMLSVFSSFLILLLVAIYYVGVGMLSRFFFFFFFFFFW